MLGHCQRNVHRSGDLCPSMVVLSNGSGPTLRCQRSGGGAALVLLRLDIVNEMATPLVSVITPAFNAETRLEDVVKVVGEQKYQSIEHVVVDDGSVDGTAALLTELEQRWPRLRSIEQQNAGRSAARNRGIAESLGQYVLFLDDDDSLDPTAVKCLVDMAIEHPKSVVHCDWKLDYNSGLAQRATVNLGSRSVFETTAEHCPFVIHACLVPRSILLEADGFDTDLDYGEDWDLWQRLGRAGVPFVGVSKALVTYKLLHRTLSSEVAKQQYLQSCLVIERAFDTDDRVANPLPKYRDGCPTGKPEIGIVNSLAWFAGIEFAQGIEFEWMTESIEAAALRSSWVPEAQSLASGFSQGIAHGRGAGGLLRKAETFPRLQEMAARFDLDDPSEIVHRRTLPTSIPFASEEVQHCRVGIAPVEFEVSKGAGRVQPWLRLPDNVHRRFPPGIYALKPDHPDATLNLARGAALATADLIFDKDLWRSLPTRSIAIARRRSLLKSSIYGLAGSSVDYGVVGSVLPNLNTATVEPSAGDLPVFDKIFTNEDPWGYDKPYEVRKYEETLELLSEISADQTVAEVACAEGHFTVRLAPLVQNLRAYDVSPIALQRLQERLSKVGIDNVETFEFDLITDQLNDQVDIIVCSEVLYYIPTDRLAGVIDMLVSGLRPGGTLVHAHAFEASQRGSKPGFGWRQPFGAQRISNTFASHPQLQRERTIETDLYLVDRFVKSSNPVQVRHEFRPIDRGQLEPDIANQVLWSGYETTPGEAHQLTTTELPVLTYHSIGTDAPPGLETYQVSPTDFNEQLDWLREHGYRTPEPWEVSALVRRGRPISGKAALITFDDAYQCFSDIAWPLLRNHGFGATMFVATSFVGDAARWDEKYGPPMKIMNAASLSELAADGLHIGSHSADHRQMTHISTAEAMSSMIRSKEELQSIIHCEVDQFAFPYGVHDLELARLAKYCGYSLAFTVSGLNVRPFDNPYTLGRFIVDGTKPPLERFASLPGHSGKPIVRRSLLRAKRMASAAKKAAVARSAQRS